MDLNKYLLCGIYFLIHTSLLLVTHSEAQQFNPFYRSVLKKDTATSFNPFLRQFKKNDNKNYNFNPFMRTMPKKTSTHEGRFNPFFRGFPKRGNFPVQQFNPFYRDFTKKNYLHENDVQQVKCEKEIALGGFCGGINTECCSEGFCGFLNVWNRKWKKCAPQMDSNDCICIKRD